MVTVLIVAILGAIAIPSLSNFLVRSQRQQVISDLMSAIAFARSEAIKRGTPVTLRANQSGDEALQGGWQIFTDPSRSGSFDSSGSPASEMLMRQDAYPSGEVKIGSRGASPQKAGGFEYMHFDSLGRSTYVSSGNFANSTNSVSVSIWRSGSERAVSTLCINFVGRVRIVDNVANNQSGACS